MASTLTRKKARSKRSPKIGNMTTLQLRALVEKMIDRKLRESASGRVRQSNHKVTTEMRRRAAAAVGRFRAGRGDISSRHDEYLATDYTT